MLKGYNGAIVRVDLTTGEMSYEKIDEAIARKYIGGVGLAAKMLWDETTRDMEPFSPDNPLLLMGS
jgi:aldehyde:ferredoxin oxidoreductase